MWNFILAIMLLVVGAAVALTGFGGKHVEDVDLDKPGSPKPFRKRIRPRGWLFLALTFTGLGLGTAKEALSFDWRVFLTYPRFFSLVKDQTTYDQYDWTKYFSYRLSLRFLLQQTYQKTRGPDVPDSIDRLLGDLAAQGIIRKTLCVKLNDIRMSTYSTEWARAARPSDAKLDQLEKEVGPALEELSRVAVKGVTGDARASCIDPTHDNPCACAKPDNDGDH